jgi:hypothetical protein
MPSAGFEPAIPASKRPQTHALGRIATEIGLLYFTKCCLESITFLSVHSCGLPFTLPPCVSESGSKLYTNSGSCVLHSCVINDTALRAQCPRHDISCGNYSTASHHWRKLETDGAGLYFICKTDYGCLPTRRHFDASCSDIENFIPLHSGWEVKYEWAESVAANCLLCLYKRNAKPGLRSRASSIKDSPSSNFVEFGTNTMLSEDKASYHILTPCYQQYEHGGHNAYSRRSYELRYVNKHITWSSSSNL